MISLPSILQNAFPHLTHRGTVFAVPRHFYFGTFCPKVKERSVSTGPQTNRVWGDSPTSILASIFPPPGAKILSVLTLELLAKNASVATLALLAVSEIPIRSLAC